MSRGLKSRAGCEGGEEERSMEPEIQTGEAVRQEVGDREQARDPRLSGGMTREC